ncbi:acetyl-CoA carboxylase biotin carboxyl carrier protein [Croceibacterium aestuarii]|uniref:acetyl-CoA carboxylase biotin carboxyl carrier protein n=1 Tax=Croceibacterium aestuarii TaxID=3064139 RepID=UPI00272E35EE|nr:acetyl-CoA carboxylase biotin carboxyl carrier protein [Croceibacterium sp. D39]
MSLTAADIAEIARLLDESKFSSLNLEMGGFKLRIRRDGGGWAGEPASFEETPEPEPAPAPEAPAPALSQEAGAARAGEVDVPAPLLGNFYSSPRPGDPPFVEVGDTVNEDTTIAIIEVMKLMNPIRAGVSGTVVAVLAENGSAVEEGQPLIRVKVG